MRRTFVVLKRRFLCFVVAASALPLWAAYADVVISSGTTSNMSCSAGVCEPTATKAVLNVSDLETMLASGNVTVTTTGSGVQADNILVDAPFGWSGGNSLTFDAEQSLTINRAISVTGTGGAMLDGELSFGQKGHVQFANVSSTLAINGTAYTLVDSISTLASAIASNPSGSYALANDYDASEDGTYGAAPIQTIFSGIFDGLGNTISKLSIKDKSPARQVLGLFRGTAEGSGTFEHIRLARIEITGGRGKDGEFIGALVGSVGGYVFQGSASGRIHLEGRAGLAGGLVGESTGNVDSSSAAVVIDATKAKGVSEAGGLIGGNIGKITESFATGSVAGGNENRVGGLVGVNVDHSAIQNSYSTGTVAGGVKAEIGGLIGLNAQGADVTAVYSTGAVSVSGGSPSYVGGLAGSNHPSPSDAYWDTDTSGTTKAVGKGKSTGITGLTTQQFQSGLPSGFDSNVWDEKSSINNGLPYLLVNPPSQ